MAQVLLRRPSPSRAFSPEIIGTENDNLQESIYIFPSLSSFDVAQHSDSLGGSLTPTEFTSSPVALSDRPSLLLSTDDESYTWEHVTNQHSRTTSLISLRPPRQPLHRHSFSSFHTRRVSGENLIPHPRFHIPFLSFFLSFLSIDETVVRLLSYTPSASTLLPGNLFVEQSVDALASEDLLESHGVEKLLCQRTEPDSLRDGLAVQALRHEASSMVTMQSEQGWIAGFTQDISSKSLKALSIR